MPTINRGIGKGTAVTHEMVGQAKARLGVLGKGKTGPRAGVPFCSRIDTADKLLRVPTGMQGGVFPDVSASDEWRDPQTS